MFWRKRRREMVRVFRRLVDFFHAELKAQEDHVITDAERRALQKESEELRQDIQRIAPPLPLTWKQWLTRLGFIFGACIFVGVVLLWRFDLLVPASTVTTAGSAGAGEEKRYVPTTAVSVYDVPLVNKISFGAPVTLASFSSLEGIVVGFIQQGNFLTALYTAKTDAGRVLMRETLNQDLVVLGNAAEVVGDRDVMDASVLAEDNGMVLALAVQTGNGPFLLVGRRGENWKSEGEPTILRPLENERLDGLGLFANDDPTAPYALLTVRLPAESEGVTSTRKVVLRLFDANFLLVKETVLEAEQLNADAHASFLPVPGVEDTGYAIVTNGGSPFEYDRVEKGDELFALAFNAEDEPMEFFRLTNNGRPHDFWPESVLIEDGEFVYFAYLRQYLPPLADPVGQYVLPEETGNVLVGVARLPKWDMVGTVIVTEFEPKPFDGEDAKAGARHAHIAKVGKRLFVLYDQVITDDPYADHPTRNVVAQWFDLNR